MHPVYPVRLQYPRYGDLLLSCQRACVTGAHVAPCAAVGYDRGEAFHPDRLQKWYAWNESKAIGFIPEVSHTFAYIDGLYGIMNEHQLAFGER